MRSGFVAVAGRPNVGKSTLVNSLCGGKVAIVSDKPQTTRRRILGIANGDDYQLVLADLPGFQRPLGIPALRDELVALLPEGPLYFPQEQRTDLPVEVQIAELVREQALQLTKDEVPHAITVEVQEIEDKVVRADVLVETESQKQIVIGKGGAMIREIGRRARPEVEQLLGHAVFLDLRVKVKPRWRRDETVLERLGI